MNKMARQCVSPLRMLALVSDAPGTGGGIATYNGELFAALSHRLGGCEVTLLPRNAPPRGQAHAAAIPGLAIIDAPASRAGFVLSALRLAASRPFHWLFCGHLHLLPLARVVSELTGARLWLQVHGIEAWQAPGPRTRQGVAKADLVTAVSRFTRRRLLEWAAVHPARVRVLNNTYGDPFGPGPPDHEFLRKVAPHGQPVILTVSRLDSRERYKGHRQVLQALATSNLQGERAPVYVICGEGDDRNDLAMIAKELGVNERVHFLGAVSPRDLPGLYRSADVFAMPSQGEGFGIVFLEAAACGVPVLAGETDGSRDALRDGLVGTLVDATDPLAVASGIAGILERPSSPEGFQVFDRNAFRHQVLGLLEDCPAPVDGERWL